MLLDNVVNNLTDKCGKEVVQGDTFVQAVVNGRAPCLRFGLIMHVTENEVEAVWSKYGVRTGYSKINCRTFERNACIAEIPFDILQQLKEEKQKRLTKEKK